MKLDKANLSSNLSILTSDGKRVPIIFGAPHNKLNFLAAIVN